MKKTEIIKLLDYLKDDISPVPSMHNEDVPLDEVEFIRLSKSFENVIDKMEEKDKRND